MYNIGYDIGSSSIKIALVNTETGEGILTITEPSQEMEISSPQANWAEQNPNTWWQHICTGTKRLINESKIDNSTITAIGIAYQMHGLVVVNEHGVPLRDAIIWCDSRAVDIGNKAFQDLGWEKCMARFLNSPGNFTASKLKWVKENEPKIYASIYKYMLPGDYIAFKLSGIVNTSKNGLSEGILLNYEEDGVATTLLDYYGIDHSFTPQIVENFTNQGEVTAKASEETGLPFGIPITYRAGDQPNNALSLNVFRPGEVAATGGTSGVLYAVTNRLQSNEPIRINHFAHVNYSSDNKVVGKLLCINGAGIQYRRLKDQTGANSYEEMNKKASEIPIGSDGVVAIPFGNGAERMFENMIIGSHICNLNPDIHSNAHQYRATLEGIAFSFIYGMEILKNDHAVINVIRAGNDNLFRSKVFSDTVATLLGHKIEIYNTTGAIGAARAASLQDRDFDKLGENITRNDHVMTYAPQLNRTPYQKAYEAWQKELEKFIPSS